MVHALAGLLKCIGWGLDYLPGSARVLSRKKPAQQEGEAGCSGELSAAVSDIPGAA